MDTEPKHYTPLPNCIQTFWTKEMMSFSNRMLYQNTGSTNLTGRNRARHNLIRRDMKMIRNNLLTIKILGETNVL